VANKTLISNWENELYMWLIGFELHFYTGGDSKRQAFFAADSPWATSTTPMHRRIIITTDVVCMRKVFFIDKSFH
jgi:hypothetical protein